MHFNSKATGLTAFALLASGMAAFSADMPIKAPYYKAQPSVISSPGWAGYYLGANAGYHMGQDSITTTTTPANFAPGHAASIDASSPATLKPAGAMAGIQGGYNWQFGNIVAGLEADFDALWGRSSRTLHVAAVPAFSMTNSTSASWLATVRPRVGYAFDSILFYATGGLAYGSVKTSDSETVVGGSGTTEATTRRLGWVAGAGLEYALSRSWSVKGEYLHVDLGSSDTSIACFVGCVTATDIIVHHHYTDDSLKLGVNYRFGS